MPQLKIVYLCFYLKCAPSSIVTVDGNKFIHKSTAKVEGVTGHTVITEFCGDKVTRLVMMAIMLRMGMVRYVMDMKVTR